MEHSKQTDGYSCGVYVLKFAEMYVRNMPLTFSFTSQDIMEERMRIGEKLLSAATNYLESRKRAVECPNQTKLKVIYYLKHCDPHFGEDNEMCPSPYPCSSGYEMTEESTPNTDNLGGRLTEQFNQSSEETTNTAFASQKTANSIETIPVASYELRKDRKRLKRESFLYFTSPKRSKREKYCVCDKPDDGRVYWMCDVCSNWYHPFCIGLKEKEVPDTFVCKSCLEIETGIMEHSGLTDGDAVTGFGKEDESHSTRISDDYIFSKYECVKQYIDDIMTCDSNDCDEYTHRRHHMFINNNKAFCTTSKKKYLYGSKYFYSNSTDKLLERLTKDYILSLHDPCRPATGLKISMLKGVPENSGLYKIFAEKKIIVPVYIVHVLAKEIACYILSEHSKFSIKKADKNCTSTEVKL